MEIINFPDHVDETISILIFQSGEKIDRPKTLRIKMNMFDKVKLEQNWKNTKSHNGIFLSAWFKGYFLLTRISKRQSQLFKRLQKSLASC